MVSVSHHLSRRLFLSGIAGTAATAILAACGGSSATATPNATSAPTKAAASTPATAGATNGTAAPAATTSSAATTAPAASATTSATTAAGSAVAPSGPVAGTLTLRRGGLAHRRERQEGKLTQDGYNFWKKTVNDAGGITVGDQRYTVDIKYLRRRIQPGHERETHREADHGRQNQLHPRPVRHEPDALRQRDHREVQEADGRGERRGGGDLQPRLQVRLLPDDTREVLPARHHRCLPR